MTLKTFEQAAPRELRPVRVSRVGNKLIAAVEMEVQGDGSESASRLIFRLRF
jgi:hypothetical protein